MNTRLWVFSGTSAGEFAIESVVPILGDSLPAAAFLSVGHSRPAGAEFCLTGVVSNERYTTRPEKDLLVARQEAIGREEARVGVLIPIKKSAAWWALTQDERRAILEDRSQHIQLGMQALPHVARRLHHCRDLPDPQPFDFLTWFDFREEDAAKFDDLLGALRATEEWEYVEREVEVRVRKVS